MLPPDELISRLVLTSTNQVLKVGAGSGYYSLEVARRISEGQLILLDIQPEMLKKAEKKIKKEGLSNVSYTIADISNLSFKEHSFDVIF